MNILQPPIDIHQVRRLATLCQLIALLGPQSRFGDKLLEIRLVCPQNGTAVLKGLGSVNMARAESL